MKKEKETVEDIKFATFDWIKCRPNLVDSSPWRIDNVTRLKLLLMDLLYPALSVKPNKINPSASVADSSSRVELWLIVNVDIYPHMESYRHNWFRRSEDNEKKSKNRKLDEIKFEKGYVITHIEKDNEKLVECTKQIARKMTPQPSKKYHHYHHHSPILLCILKFISPPEFLNDEDILTDFLPEKEKPTTNNNKGSSTGFYGFGSHLSSPVEFVMGSTEIESDEEDYLTGLTRKLCNNTLSRRFMEIIFQFLCMHKTYQLIAPLPNKAKGQVYLTDPVSTPSRCCIETVKGKQLPATRNQSWLAWVIGALVAEPCRVFGEPGAPAQRLPVANQQETVWAHTPKSALWVRYNAPFSYDHRKST
ncbi:hypothetical protein OSB04_008780 [Centaurea solstitialis]|uniref:Uncharacterized protein n=1 Tax=Centaurea solstitialis TaxID=347529 RepID=A0AA38TZ79_9ASTR|nr:hypothetical protein OSB04_008780 [Centaurea solstitialis]